MTTSSLLITNGSCYVSRRLRRSNSTCFPPLGNKVHYPMILRVLEIPFGFNDTCDYVVKNRSNNRWYSTTVARTGFSGGNNFFNSYRSSKKVNIQKISRYHSFSTLSNVCGGDEQLKVATNDTTPTTERISDIVIDNPTTTANPLTNGQILEITSIEAKELLNRIKAIRSQKSITPKEEVIHAKDLAQTFLVNISYPPEQLKDAICNVDNDYIEDKKRSPSPPSKVKSANDHVDSLHYALISITSWCISLIPNDPSLLHTVHGLVYRSNEINLPLIRPLYEKISIAAAKYGSNDTILPSSLILEVASCIQNLLELPILSSYFDAVLPILIIERNQLLGALTLIRSAKERYDVASFDFDITMNILDHLHDILKSEPKNTAANQLVLLLKGSLNHHDNHPNLGDIRTLSTEPSNISLPLLPTTKSSSEPKVSSITQKYSAGDVMKINKLIKEFIQELDLENITPDKLRLLSMLESVLTNSPDDPEDIIASISTLVEEVKDNKWDLSEEEEEGNEYLDDDDDDYDDLYPSDEEVFGNDRIYNRTSPSSLGGWYMPDIIEQLERFNRGNSVLYTKEYEERILQELQNEESYDEEFQFDDDDDGDGKDDFDIF